MKLFDLPMTFGLASLFYNLASAKITFTELPAVVQVGELYVVEYISDREYEIKDFRVMHRVGRFEEPLGGIVDHYISLSAGKTRAEWRVPDLKAGTYDFFLAALEVDENGQTSPDMMYYVNSNTFEIGGRHGLRPIETAEVIGGVIAGMALLVGFWIVCARLVRRERSLAVDLSDGDEGGYTDVGER